MEDPPAQEDHAERVDGTELEPAANVEPQPATDDPEFAEPAAESAAAAEAADTEGDSTSHADEGTAQLRDVEPAEQALAGAAATVAPEQAELVEAAAAEQAVAELGSQPAVEPAAEEPAAELSAAEPAAEPARAELTAAKPAAAAAAEGPTLQPPAAEQASEPQPPEAPLQQQAPAPKPCSAAPKAAEAPAALAAEPVATKPSAAPAAAGAGALASPRETAKQLQHGKPHQETAAERLTTPTAMRMLHTLEATQGGKTEFHIASGVVYKGKKLATDELSAMVDRLAVPKHAGDAALPPKPHAVKLVYEENKEQLVPVKEVTKEENIAFMAQLYTRCQETHAKTQQNLADKYLQPLVKPKASSPKK